MRRNLIRLPKVMDKTGKCRSSIYSDMAEDKFPKQIRIGGSRSVAWDEGEIDQWIEDRIAERDAA